MLRPLAIFALALACAGAPRLLAGAQAPTTPPAAAPRVTADNSLGQLARELRAERARAAAVRVYTNRTIPPQGTVSSPGAPPPTMPAANAASIATSAASSSSSSDDVQLQAAWQKKFADARQQLTLDQQKLDVSQREYNLAQQQYFSDPNKALQQQFSRSDLDTQAQQITALKAKVAADQQAISDLTEQLRQAGLPAAWAQ